MRKKLLLGVSFVAAVLLCALLIWRYAPRPVALTLPACIRREGGTNWEETSLCIQGTWRPRFSSVYVLDFEGRLEVEAIPLTRDTETWNSGLTIVRTSARSLHGSTFYNRSGQTPGSATLCCDDHYTVFFMEIMDRVTNVRYYVAAPAETPAEAEKIGMTLCGTADGVAVPG